MNNAERNYSACKREASTEIFALKKSTVYVLFTRKAVPITDNYAVQDAFKKKCINGIFDLWIAFLAEYDFEIEYNKASDFLLRLGMTVNSTEDRKANRDKVCRLKTSSHEYWQRSEPHLIDREMNVDILNMVHGNKGHWVVDATKTFALYGY